MNSDGPMAPPRAWLPRLRAVAASLAPRRATMVSTGTVPPNTSARVP